MRSAIIVIVCVVIFGGVFFAVQKRKPETEQGFDAKTTKSAKVTSPSKSVVKEKVTQSTSSSSSKVEESKIEVVKAPTPWANEKEELEAKEKWLMEYKEKVLEAIRLTQTTKEDKRAIKEFEAYLTKLWDEQSKGELKKLTFQEMENAKIPDEVMDKFKEELNREPSSND